MKRPKRRPVAAHEAVVTIAGIGALGDGVGESGGERLYVPLAAPGDRVRVRVTERRGDGLLAQPLELLASGTGRAEPECRHFGDCGGCSAQHLEAGAYRVWKRGLLTAALAREGLADAAVAPLAVLPLGGRRRARLAARRLPGRVVLGFNEARSNRIVDIAECPVLAPALAAAVEPLRQVLSAVLAPGEAADLSLALLDDGIDLVVHAGRDPTLAERERLSDAAAALDLARLSWQTAAGPVEPVAHRRPGRLAIAGHAVIVPPGGFLQADPAAEATLQRLVAEAVDGAAAIADLFCGIGTFALALASRASVLAVDADAAAIAALDRAGRAAGLAGTLQARRRDLHRDPLAAAELARFEAVVLDPPRAGARDQAAQLAASGVARVAMVSCHPGTFARDARILADGGLRLVQATPVDQFVWSPHLEIVGAFSRA